MKELYLDVCASEKLADVRVAYHEQLNHKNINKEQVASATVANVKGTEDKPSVRVVLDEEGDDLWLVSAEG